MSAEREAFKALAAEMARHTEAVNKLAKEAVAEFFEDHPCVARLKTTSPMAVRFYSEDVNAEELAKLAKCLKALEDNLSNVSGTNLAALEARPVKMAVAKLPTHLHVKKTSAWVPKYDSEVRLSRQFGTYLAESTGRVVSSVGDDNTVFVDFGNNRVRVPVDHLDETIPF